MTQVEFVKLKRPEKARHLCELAEHFFNDGNKVLIIVGDKNQAVTLDRFMWTWHKGSFIPHAFNNGAVDCLDEPIIIEIAECNPHAAEILIMGRPCSSEFMSHFRHVIDFAEVYDQQLASDARQRYASYRQTGFSVAMR